jgi:large subunit ribosomal protein L3
MAIELLGKKLGMSRMLFDDGSAASVTLIEVLPNRVVQIKTEETEGYSALQLAAGAVKSSCLSKPQVGVFKKAGMEGYAVLREMRLLDLDGYNVGDELSLEKFVGIKKVDVQGVSKGKGFAGGVKRWNFGMQDATHGNSISHRAIGSTGQCQTPGRVLKGKKMPGQMGNKNVSVQGLKVMKCDVSSNLLIVKGAVPGSNGGNVVLKVSTRK